MFEDAPLHFFFRQRGYEAPPTFGLNPDTPTLEMGRDEEEGSDDWAFETLFPPQILLRIRPQGIRVSDRLPCVSPVIQYRHEDQILPPLAFYGNSSPLPLYRCGHLMEVTFLPEAASGSGAFHESVS